ncbi:hypothetical protein Tco_0686588 [Tanacetum coccineum]
MVSTITTRNAGRCTAATRGGGTSKIVMSQKVMEVRRLGKKRGRIKAGDVAEEKEGNNREPSRDGNVRNDIKRSRSRMTFCHNCYTLLRKEHTVAKFSISLWRPIEMEKLSRSTNENSRKGLIRPWFIALGLATGLGCVLMPTEEKVMHIAARQFYKS